MMLYTQKTHSDPMVDYGSSAFVPFVLSDPGTTMGPVWMNHSAVYKPESEWRSTDYLTGDDLNDEAAGDIFCFQKSSSGSNAASVLMDYVIEFKELSANPKRGILPLERTAWFQTSLGQNALATTAGTTQVSLTPFGNNLSGGVAVEPTGASLGDIYKVLIDTNNSSFGAANVTNLFKLQYPNAAITISNGYTLYCVRDSISPSAQFRFFSSLAQAQAGTFPLVYGLTTGSLTFNLEVWMTLVGGYNAQAGL
jgi:hypothetical protein